MADWKMLEKDLTAWLKQRATEGLVYKNPNQAIPGFPSNGFRSDGLLTDGVSLLVLEVEAAQMHPDTNVAKYWFLQHVHSYKNITLVHVYTPRFNSYGWRKELGDFCAKKMEKEMPFTYHQMDYRTISDSKYPYVFKTVKEAMQCFIKQLFTK